MFRRINKPNQQPNRRGVAATEFAVCLPVIVLLVLGMIETCSMIFVKQSLAVAAYEGAHTAVKDQATAAEVRATCNSILADRRVNAATVSVLPNDLPGTPPGDFMTVRISAPSDQNGLLPLRFFRGKTLEASAVIMKEI
ncbi:MAG: TadE/TadG family type IV pilus assembly protein [Aeoliella sp.]